MYFIMKVFQSQITEYIEYDIANCRRTCLCDTFQCNVLKGKYLPLVILRRFEILDDAYKRSPLQRADKYKAHKCGSYYTIRYRYDSIFDPDMIRDISRVEITAQRKSITPYGHPRNNYYTYEKTKFHAHKPRGMDIFF
jgi:hypothetical protein